MTHNMGIHSPRLDLLTASQLLGLPPALFCLDAGHEASLPAASQRWIDLIGSAYSFRLGSGTGVDGADPTINGGAGRRSSAEYLSFDGGDYLTSEVNPNGASINDMHRDNAKFTMAGWAYIGSLGIASTLSGTKGASSGTGLTYTKPTTDALRIAISNAGADVLTKDSSNAFLANSWNFHGVTIDEAAATGSLVLNGVTTNFVSTYSLPSAGSASRVLQIGARGDNNTPMDAGGRLGSFALWAGTALTAAELVALFQKTRSKYGV